MRTQFYIAVAAVSAATILAAPARAAGPFDGSWVIDVPASASAAQRADANCPALRLPVKIADNQVSGSLTRVPSTGGGQGVQQGTGRASAPVTGTVQADGSVTAQWEGYKASGKLAGDGGTVTIVGQCGPRKATATRVAK
jgi:hypothetical protein